MISRLFLYDLKILNKIKIFFNACKWLRPPKTSSHPAGWYHGYRVWLFGGCKSENEGSMFYECVLDFDEEWNTPDKTRSEHCKTAAAATTTASSTTETRNDLLKTEKKTKYIKTQKQSKIKIKYKTKENFRGQFSIDSNQGFCSARKSFHTWPDCSHAVAGACVPIYAPNEKDGFSKMIILLSANPQYPPVTLTPCTSSPFRASSLPRVITLRNLKTSISAFFGLK